jgi:hypothetical protein
MQGVARTSSYTAALRRALAAVDPAQVDAAAVALAYGYTRQLDNAAVAARYLQPLKELRQAVAAAEHGAEALVKIETALSVHSVHSDLGPKLLATLDALGMTPKGRAAIIGKGAPTREPAASPLDELRARRAARAAG